MFERFTERARRVLVLAQEEARRLQHNYIGTEHILLGLLGEVDGIAERALRALGVTLEEARAKVAEVCKPTGAGLTGSAPFTPRAKKVLELSLREALRLEHNYIGTEHMLLGLVREGEGVGAQVLQQLGTDLRRVREQVLSEVRQLPREGREPGPGRAVGRSWRDLPMGWRDLRQAGASPSFASARREGGPDEAPYCPGCGKGLMGNLRYVLLSAEGTEPGAPALGLVCSYCTSCGFPLGLAAGTEGVGGEGGPAGG